MNYLKKSFPRILFILFGLIAGIVISGVLFAFTGFSIFGGIGGNAPSRLDSDNAGLTSLSYKVIDYIRDGDYNALSKVAHPEFGVVFSPCATVNLMTNRQFMPEQIAGFGDDSNIYIWGVRNGSGEPIEMTPNEYFSMYVNDKDYSAASIVGVDHIVRSGNALDNIKDVFVYARFVDFFVAGDDGDSPDDLSWSILRLGFEEYEGELRLTVIIRSKWTE